MGETMGFESSSFRHVPLSLQLAEATRSKRVTVWVRIPGGAPLLARRSLACARLPVKQPTVIQGADDAVYEDADRGDMILVNAPGNLRAGLDGVHDDLLLRLALPCH